MGKYSSVQTRYFSDDTVSRPFPNSCNQILTTFAFGGAAIWVYSILYSFVPYL